MSLLEQQKALARLLTDPGFREGFISQPEAAGQAVGLREQETDYLLKMADESLSAFADSLVWKRLREVEKLLPITRQLSGERFHRIFFEFAPTFNTQAVKKHCEDAIAFSRFIETRDLPESVRDVARFERTSLLFFNQNRRFAWCRSRYAMRDISGSVTRLKRGSIAVWLRFGSRFFHFTV